MDKKHLLRIEEQKETYPGYREFDIPMVVNINWWQWLFYKEAGLGIRMLNKNGYFTNLIDNFKGEDNVCYLLSIFHSFVRYCAGEVGGTQEFMDTVLSFSPFSRMLKIDVVMFQNILKRILNVF